MARKVAWILLFSFPLLIVIGLVVFMCAVAGGAFESVYAREGTIKAWFMFVSDTATDVPRVGDVHAVELYTSSGDGPKPPSEGISYLTDAPRDLVLREMECYFQRLGFVPSTDRWSHFSRGAERAIVAIDDESQRTRLVVTIYDRP